LMPGEAGGAVHRGVGFYDDELVKTAQGWRIKFRRFTSVQMTVTKPSGRVQGDAASKRHAPESP